MGATQYRITVADLAVLPEGGRRYEVIDGELYASSIPHTDHQDAAGQPHRLPLPAHSPTE